VTTVDQQQRPGPPAPRRRSRRDEILEIAVGLFAARGYHGVSMDDIGSAAGVTGPALYHHFAGKEAMLAAALIPVSEGLLHGGRERVARHPEDARAALTDLIEFHVEFALANPVVAAVIPGASRPGRIAEDRAALEEAIPADFWHELRAAGLVNPAAPLPTAA